MPTYAWYTGPASVRTIKASDWTAASIANTGDTVWNSANQWSIDQATLSAGQIAYLATQSDFSTGNAGLRPVGAAVGNPDSPVTQSQLSQLLAKAFASDGGSISQWLPNTPATGGSIWAYQGTIYLRKIDGTDAVWTRSNWTALGADPNVANQSELFGVVLGTTQTFALPSNIATFTDIPGMTVSPVVPAGGRPIYVDVDVTHQASVAASTLRYRLYDVTAGAAVAGNRDVYVAAALKTDARFFRWRIVPPMSGARVYQLQVSSATALNYGCYGADFGTASSITAGTR